MSASGAAEIDVMLLQMALSFLGACAGVRIVDDLRQWRSARMARAQERTGD